MKPAVCLVCGTGLEGDGYNGCCSKECARVVGRLTELDLGDNKAFTMSIREAMAVEISLISTIPLMEMEAGRVRSEKNRKAATNLLAGARTALEKIQALLKPMRREEMDES